MLYTGRLWYQSKQDKDQKSYSKALKSMGMWPLEWKLLPSRKDSFSDGRIRLFYRFKVTNFQCQYILNIISMSSMHYKTLFYQGSLKLNQCHRSRSKCQRRFCKGIVQKLKGGSLKPLILFLSFYLSNIKNGQVQNRSFLSADLSSPNIEVKRHLQTVQDLQIWPVFYHQSLISPETRNRDANQFQQISSFPYYC